MTITIIEPAGSGRVISEKMVAANRQRNPQLRGANPACGRSQTAAPATRGAVQRQCYPFSLVTSRRYSRGGAGLIGARHEATPLTFVLRLKTLSPLPGTRAARRPTGRGESGVGGAWRAEHNMSRVAARGFAVRGSGFAIRLASHLASLMAGGLAGCATCRIWGSSFTPDLY